MEQLRRLNDQKNQLGTGIAELESRLDRMSAEARNSIGIMLVSGMVIGTLFTLFVVPSIYMLVARARTASVAAEYPVRHHGVELATQGW